MSQNNIGSQAVQVIGKLGWWGYGACFVLRFRERKCQQEPKTLLGCLHVRCHWWLRNRGRHTLDSCCWCQMQRDLGWLFDHVCSRERSSKKLAKKQSWMCDFPGKSEVWANLIGRSRLPTFHSTSDRVRVIGTTFRSTTTTSITMAAATVTTSTLLQSNAEASRSIRVNDKRTS